MGVPLTKITVPVGIVSSISSTGSNISIVIENEAVKPLFDVTVTV